MTPPHPVHSERADVILAAREQVAAGRSVFLFGGVGVGKSHVGEAILSELAAAGAVTATLPLLAGTTAPSPDAIGTVDTDHRAVEEVPAPSLDELEAELTRLGPSPVVFIDDAHRLTPPQYSWVRSLIERQVATVIAAFATAHAVPSEVVSQFSKLWRDDPARRFDLHHLTRTETDRMIDELADRQIDAEARERIHRDSGGLPLFVRELVLDIVDTSRDIALLGCAFYPLAPLPSCSTIAVVQHRVQRLTEDQRDGLMVLALLDGIPMERAMRYFGDDVVRRLLVLGHLTQVPGSTSIHVSHPIEAATIRAASSDEHLAELARGLARQLRSDLPSRVRATA